ncbi:MAG: BadF/BadG/BcrA/BcrD ATPase family protein [Reyranellaceae bacterium]
MADALFLGIDAGGTHCRARLVDGDGTVLGSGQAGPANLTIGAERAHKSIMTACTAAFDAAHLRRSASRRTHLAIGAAGADDPAAVAALADRRLPFASVTIRSDAVTACIGAHGDDDGGLLIVGTGSQGIVRRKGRFQRVGGWGFTLSDHGSAAVLGHAAARHALVAHEGAVADSLLSRRIMRRFGNSPRKMLTWSRTTTPGDWGAFSPLVFACAESGDAAAQRLVDDAVGDVARLLDRMVALGALRIALVGGLAARYAERLPRRLTRRLVPAKRDALAGAIDLARAAAHP